MAEETTLQKAYRQSQLWPPIYAAVDVFRRRKISQAEPYELTWRLIHVWECVVLTLVQTAVSRLMRNTDEHEKDLRIIREKCYGVGWESSEGTIKKRTGALDGSMDKWIEVLEYVSTVDAGESCYLTSLNEFLNGKANSDNEDATRKIDLTPFTSAWARACDIPSGLNRGKVIVKDAFKIVNSFRNRLAHVPFPYDPLADVYHGLQSCTEQLFDAEPSPTGPRGVLNGCIGFRGHVIKGSTPQESSILDGSDGSAFIFGYTNKGSCDEQWNACLFIHIDNMLRPYILTRLKDEAGLWEYTRYLAESNAVVAIQKPEYLEQLPIPSDREYLTESENEPCTTPETEDPSEKSETADHTQNVGTKVESMGDAIGAIQSRQFAPAISFLEDYLLQRRNYHVGWLRLGHAKREYAVDSHIQSEADGTQNSERIRELLESSLKDFRKAQEHVSTQYKAEAHYHASKSHFRLWQYFNDDPSKELALEEATEAAKLYPDSKYDSWIEFLWNAH